MRAVVHSVHDAEGLLLTDTSPPRPLMTLIGMPFPKKLAFAEREKIFALARRGAKLDLEAQQAINRAFQVGRGGMYLNLTKKQDRKLQ